MGALLLQPLHRPECLLIDNPVLRLFAGDMFTLVPWTDDALLSLANHLSQLVLVPGRAAHIECIVKDSGAPRLHAIDGRSIPPATTRSRDAVHVEVLSNLPGSITCET